MLPTNFYISPHGDIYGDKAWLIEWLDKLPIRKQKPVAIRYGEIYQELVLSDPNNCRYRSNTWLRKTVQKVCEEFQKNSKQWYGVYVNNRARSPIKTIIRISTNRPLKHWGVSKKLPSQEMRTTITIHKPIYSGRINYS